MAGDREMGHSAVELEVGQMLIGIERCDRTCLNRNTHVGIAEGCVGIDYLSAAVGQDDRIVATAAAYQANRL